MNSALAMASRELQSMRLNLRKRRRRLFMSATEDVRPLDVITMTNRTSHVLQQPRRHDGARSSAVSVYCDWARGARVTTTAAMRSSRSRRTSFAARTARSPTLWIIGRPQYRATVPGSLASWRAG